MLLFKKAFKIVVIKIQKSVSMTMKLPVLFLLATAPGASAFSSVGRINNVGSSSSSSNNSNSRRSTQQLQATTKSLEAILFDCDGVIADTERDGHRISFNIAFQENGIDETWDEQRYGKLLEVGGGKERMTAHWVSYRLLNVSCGYICLYVFQLTSIYIVSHSLLLFSSSLERSRLAKGNSRGRPL